MGGEASADDAMLHEPSSMEKPKWSTSQMAENDADRSVVAAAILQEFLIDLLFVEQGVEIDRTIEG